MATQNRLFPKAITKVNRNWSYWILGWNQVSCPAKGWLRKASFHSHACFGRGCWHWPSSISIESCPASLTCICKEWKLEGKLHSVWNETRLTAAAQDHQSWSPGQSERLWVHRPGSKMLGPRLWVLSHRRVSVNLTEPSEGSGLVNARYPGPMYRKWMVAGMGEG